MATPDAPARAEPTLDVGRLRLLRAVARHGSIAAGARSLGLTASAVSQQLAVLERETGAALLSRSPRGAVLTAAGEALAARAGDVLGLLEQARAELDLLTGRVAGPVVVSTVASAAATLVARAAAAVPADVDLRVVVAEPGASVDALLAGEADLAVVDEYDYVPWARPELGAPVELAVEPLLAVLPESRSWPREVALTALAGEAWVMPPDDAACGRAVRSACRAAGFEPRVAWETDDMWVLATAVAAGHGVTVLPRSAIAPAPGLRLRPLAAGLARRVQLLTRPAAAARPAVVAVRDAIVGAARS
ncbi:LysR family transcriptional regulator [Jatrophihabitans sp. YIM 134969]